MTPATWRSLGQASALAGQVALALAIGGYAGRWLAGDLGMFAGLAIGLGVGVVAAQRMTASKGD